MEASRDFLTFFRLTPGGQTPNQSSRKMVQTTWIHARMCLLQKNRYFSKSVALLVARRTNNRKVVGSRPAKVVCITVLTGNRLGWTVRCCRPPLLLPSCRNLEFRLSALMDSDLAWVNGISAYRQSWWYADAFKRSIISGAIYHLPPDLHGP